MPADPNDLLLVSASAAGAGGNGESFGPSLSADGRLVAFSSTATNLHPADTDTEFDVYVKDLATGAVTLVSRAADGTKADARTTGGAISVDGTRVALSTKATNLHPSGSPGLEVCYGKTTHLQGCPIEGPIGEACGSQGAAVRHQAK